MVSLPATGNECSHRLGCRILVLHSRDGIPLCWVTESRCFGWVTVADLGEPEQTETTSDNPRSPGLCVYGAHLPTSLAHSVDFALSILSEELQDEDQINASGLARSSRSTKPKVRFLYSPPLV